LLADGPFTQETQLDPVETPVLLLPFLVRAARVSQRSLAVDWQGGSLQISPDGAFDKGAATAWTAMKLLALRIKPSPHNGTPALPAEPAQLLPIHASTLNGLDALALRTTVPATQASRSGAGSSTPDND
jgi:hypothetical protein